MAILDDLNKKFGQGTVFKLSDKPTECEVISTGIIGVDVALGVGGLPRGRIIEIIAEEAVGKTGLALQVAANAQKNGGNVAFIDMEHAIDPKFAGLLGVQLDELYVSQPDHGNQAIDLLEEMVRSGEYALIIFDSVAAAVPKQELEGDAGDALPGLHARLMSQACRKLTPIISQSNTCVIFLNQYRSKIGVMGYGPTKAPTGGNALKYATSVRIELSKIKTLKNKDDEVVGHTVRAKVIKNKVAPPFKEAEYDIIYGEENSIMLGELINHGCELGIIEKKGAWFKFNEQSFQGVSNLRDYIKENKELADKLLEDIKGALGL